mmetsp:Transcript_11790/g.16164  ORF Transcript_11790/g.16164 Transcript_11790/m.16164 type:complete len:80 (-) Transcript_11790:89-328(-)
MLCHSGISAARIEAPLWLRDATPLHQCAIVALSRLPSPVAHNLQFKSSTVCICSAHALALLFGSVKSQIELHVSRKRLK